jgi:hypothetical protein
VLSEADRAKLEAVRVAEPSERLQALDEAFGKGLFDFVTNLLAPSYSLLGRRPHHPLLLLKVWLAMLAAGSTSPAVFLRQVDDSVELRLFLEAMSHEYTIAKAIHRWHEGDIFHYGPRSDVDRKKKGIFVEEDFDVHELVAICPNGASLHRKPNVFVRGSSEQRRYRRRRATARDAR